MIGNIVNSSSNFGRITFEIFEGQDLEKIAQKIAGRVSRYLEKAGYLIRDTESEYLDLYTDEEDAMLSIVGASSETALVRHPGRSYRLAFGPNAGK